MSRVAEDGGALRRVTCSIDIDADTETVFEQWTHFDRLPRILDGVRRTKRIGDRRILWDADVVGRQVVWEAEIVECEPGKRVRWVSCWGAHNAGEVQFEPLPAGGTLMTVDFHFAPRGPIEALGARLGLLRLWVQRDLEHFRRHVETLPLAGE